MSDDEATLVEAVAKAISNVLVDNIPSSWPWEKATPAGRELLTLQAQAAIEAVRAARRKPTNDEIEAEVEKTNHEIVDGRFDLGTEHMVWVRLGARATAYRLLSSLVRNGLEAK